MKNAPTVASINALAGHVGAVDRLNDIRGHHTGWLRSVRRHWTVWLFSFLLHVVTLLALIVFVVEEQTRETPRGIVIFQSDPGPLPVEENLPLPDLDRLHNQNAPADDPLAATKPKGLQDHEVGLPDNIGLGAGDGPLGDGGGDWDGIPPGAKLPPSMHHLDVVFVFDATGSMGGIILETKTRIRELMRVVTYLVPDARVGLVAYRDLEEFSATEFEYTTRVQPLTQDMRALETFLRQTQPFGGGDIPEAVYEGVEAAIQRAGWRPAQGKIIPARVIVVFGDAPPRSENDGLNKLNALAKKWHRSTGGVVSCIDTTGDGKLMQEFKDLAAHGGGDATSLQSQDQIIAKLVTYIFGPDCERDIQRVMEFLNRRERAGPRVISVTGD